MPPTPITAASAPTPVTAGSRFEHAAVALAASGYYVHPLRSRAKVPASRNGFKDASRDERQITRWWGAMADANIGVACGASGIVVFDVDSKAGADPREVLAELDLAGAPVVATGEAPEQCEKHPRSLAGVRGAQVYFRGSLPSVPRLSIPGTEIKGDGGYVIAPPSVHPSGVEYLGDPPAVEELPAAPEWLRELVQAPQRTERPPLPRDASGDPLLAIPASIYVPALSGRQPGPDWKIRCPFHDDATPSLHIYPADRGWVCFGCKRGGSIIDFGAALYGIEPRGRGFHDLRRRIASALLGREAA